VGCVIPQVITKKHGDNKKKPELLAPEYILMYDGKQVTTGGLQWN
jgi:hypothetical protein